MPGLACMSLTLRTWHRTADVERSLGELTLSRGTAVLSVSPARVRQVVQASQQCYEVNIRHLSWVI